MGVFDCIDAHMMHASCLFVIDLCVFVHFTHARTCTGPPAPLEGQTYLPNEVIVQMHQGADRLIIIVEGIVEIAFEHPTLHLPKCRDFVKGDYLGDFSILGDTDWGNSTAFSLLVNTTREPVDIEARAAPSSFVVVLELELKKFQEALSKSSFTTTQSGCTSSSNSMPWTSMLMPPGMPTTTTILIF